jgi:hypothetical protein
MGDPTQQHCSADLVLRSRTQDSFVRAGRTLGPLLDWFADIDSARDASASARDILVKGLR